jgi:hypothetical protein
VQPDVKQNLAAYRKRVAPAVTGRVLEIRTGSGLSQTLYSLKNVQQVIRVVPSAKGKRVSE